MIEPTLYPKQQVLIDEVRAALMAGHKEVLMQAVTGFGKTVLAADLIIKSRKKGFRQVFIVPRKELLRQTSESFDQFEISHSYVAAEKSFNPYAKTHICTVGTLVNRLDKINPHVAFIDETHFGDSQLEKIINNFKKRGIIIIGATATPMKLSGMPMRRWYSHMVCGPSTRWCIDNNYLSDYRLFAPSEPNLTGIKTLGGDYAKGELSERMEQDRVLVGDAVNHYLTHSNGRLNMAFCVSIKASKMTAQMFRDAGIPAVHMDGDTPEDERRRIARAFARREIRTLCTVDLCLFGYDLASAAGMPAVVESMTDLRPTKSLPLQLQKWGRVLRRKDDPAMIMDHAGNSFFRGETNHGLPCEERLWTLSGITKQDRDEEPNVGSKQCTQCFYVYPPAKACPNCGFVEPIKSREIGLEEGELEEITAMKQGSLDGMNQENDPVFAAKIEEGRKLGMGNPELWAKNALAAEKMLKSGKL